MFRSFVKALPDEKYNELYKSLEGSEKSLFVLSATRSGMGDAKIKNGIRLSKSAFYAMRSRIMTKAKEV